MRDDVSDWANDCKTGCPPQTTGKQPSRRLSGKQIVPKLGALHRKASTPSQPPPAKHHTPRSRPRRSESKVEEPNSPLGSARGSVCSSSLLDTHSTLGEEEFEPEPCPDNVKVLVRIRPATDAEAREGVCVTKASSTGVLLQQPGHEAQSWRFDYVAGGSATQEEMFQVGGQAIVENCVAGYNSSIFAYGQTGAGKTHTMQGSLSDPDQRGLAARVFEWLFKRISEEESAAGRDSLRYSCKCSFLEIYNETISDLLKPGATNLQLREDASRGCFVDGLSEEIVLNGEEAAALLRKGAQNRRIGQTRMNHESSRSHSVFTCTIESAARATSGLATITSSRLNLVDLAGSERNKASGATGEHLKEACLINQSLTALGRVIMELTDAQRSRRQGHIPYRDSRLTFLLQESLGGNAKSTIIANVSPATSSCHETLSTLQFVSRAKQIRNKAVVNQDTQAVSMEVLKRELQRLYRELDLARSDASEPLVAEVARLTGELEEARRQADEARAALNVAASESRLARTGAAWAEARVAKLERERSEMHDVMICILTQEGAATLPPPDAPLLEFFASVRSRANAAAEQALTESGARLERVHSLEAAQAELQALHNQQLSASQAQAAEVATLQHEKLALQEQLEAWSVRHREALHAQEQDTARLRNRLESQEEAAAGLERQVACIREELAKQAHADQAERVHREADNRQLAAERDAAQAALAAAQADVVAERQKNLQAEQAAADCQQAQALAEQRLAGFAQRMHASEAALAAALSRAQQAESDRDRARREGVSGAEVAERERQKAEKAGQEALVLQQEYAAYRDATEPLKEQLATARQELEAERHGKKEAEERAVKARAESARLAAAGDALHLQLSALSKEASAEGELHRLAKRALKDQTARMDLELQAQTVESMELRSELEALKAALGDSRQTETDALLRAARFKHMLGDIDNIIKWARSPGGAPTACVPSFRTAGSLPSPAGKTNPLFVAQHGLSLSQEWARQVSLPGATPPPASSGRQEVDHRNLGGSQRTSRGGQADDSRSACRARPRSSRRPSLSAEPEADAGRAVQGTGGSRTSPAHIDPPEAEADGGHRGDRTAEKPRLTIELGA